MAVETAYVCDRCGKRQDTDDQMWVVAVQVSHHGYRHDSSPWKSDARLWCRECVDQMHVLGVPSAEKAAKLPPAPTFEDLLREVVRDEIAGAAQQ